MPSAAPPITPQTQGKIERWQPTLKNRILLENYYLPGDLKASIGAFVERYNHHRYHEGLGNLNPRRRLLRPGPGHHREKEKDQKTDRRKTTLGAPTPSRLTSTTITPEPPL